MNFKPRESLLCLAILATLTALPACSSSPQGEDASPVVSENTQQQELSQEQSSSSVRDDSTESTLSFEAVSKPQALSTDVAVNLADVDGLFSNRDLDPSYDSATELDITGTDTDVVINTEGSYVLRGNLVGGSIIVDVADTEKVQLILDGVSITTNSSTAVYVRNANKVFMTLAAGSTNTIEATGASTTEDDTTLDGAIFARDDFTINGTGSLVVSSTSGHGIVGKDELTLVSGDVSIDAQEHAIQAKDSLAIAGGTWTINAGGDGLHASHDTNSEKGFVYIAGGELTINCANDGIDASNFIQIDGGSLAITCGDDGIHAEYDLVINDGTISVEESYEALEGATITVTGGNITAVASDDGFNAAGEPSENTSQELGPQGFGDMFGYDATACLTIVGGTVVVDAQGDGLDSNGDLIVEGGEIFVSGPVSDGDGALDIGEGGNATITGGTLVATGSSGMAINFTSATQGSALVSLAGDAQDTLYLSDEDGTTLVSFTPTKSYSSVLVSTQSMEEGKTYTLANGTNSTSFTLTSTIYSEFVGMGGAGFGMGGPMGGPDGDMGGPMGGPDGAMGGPMGGPAGGMGGPFGGN